MPLFSLQEQCVRVLTVHRRHIGSIGETPVVLVYSVLARCEPELLARIEDQTVLDGRSLKQETWHLWQKHYQKLFGNQPCEVPTLPGDSLLPRDIHLPRDARPGDWRFAYEAAHAELQCKLGAAAKHASHTTALLQQEKERNKLIVVDKSPAAKRVVQRHPGTLPPPNIRARLCKKLGVKSSGIPTPAAASRHGAARPAHAIRSPAQPITSKHHTPVRPGLATTTRSPVPSRAAPSTSPRGPVATTVEALPLNSPSLWSSLAPAEATARRMEARKLNTTQRALPVSAAAQLQRERASALAVVSPSRTLVTKGNKAGASHQLPNKLLFDSQTVCKTNACTPPTSTAHCPHTFERQGTSGRCISSTKPQQSHTFNGSSAYKAKGGQLSVTAAKRLATRAVESLKEQGMLPAKRKTQHDNEADIFRRAR